MLQNRFTKILVPLDGSLNSNRGLNEALSLAMQTSGSVTGFHVIPISGKKPRNVMNKEEPPLIHESKAILEKARTNAKIHQVHFVEKMKYATNIVTAITDEAKNGKYDIIVIGSRGKGNPKADFLGSVAYGVLNSTKIPVTVVK